MTRVDRILRVWRTFSARPLLLRGALVVLVAVGGFFLARWVIDTATDGSLGQSGRGESLVYGFDSLAEAVSFSERVVLVRVVGDPADRTVTSGSTTVLQKDVEVEVLRYLKGAGAGLITVAQSYQDTETAPSGAQVTIADEYYVPLPKGNTYVLFLREGAPGTWIPFGEPIGFEADGHNLLAISGRISPAEWGLSTLDDLTEQVEAITAGATAQPPGQPAQ